MFTTSTILSFACGSLLASGILFAIFAVREWSLRNEITAEAADGYRRGYRNGWKDRDLKAKAMSMSTV